MKEKILTVKISDCIVQTFRAGGKGGQKQNKTESGVRVIHEPSGARGESREHATQPQNKRAAFVRMGESKEFQNWAWRMGMKLPSVNDVVDDMMQQENLLVEYFNSGLGRNETSNK